MRGLCYSAVSYAQLFIDRVVVVVGDGQVSLGQTVMKQAEIRVRVLLGSGTAEARLWTCDLSHDYVTINAEYRT